MESVMICVLKFGMPLGIPKIKMEEPTMKKLSLVLVLALAVSLLAGCAGTPVVYYSDCTCPSGSHSTAETPSTVPESTAPIAEGAVKTGLAILGSLSGTDASADALGQVKYDVTMVAVNVDDSGVITACVIDGLGATVEFDATGAITTDVTAAPATKNELGSSYGMVAYGGATAEWDAQAAALAAYAVGKTVEELKNGAIDETGYAADADLATTATIYLGGYVSAIEAAVNNARHLGAQAGDVLKLASVNDLSASGEGTIQLDSTVTALTMNGEAITSCYIDALQAKAAVDGSGVITSDLTAVPQTKNQLGENYGMVAWGGAKYEWNEQAANFAAYVTGKTLQDVMGIAVTETTKPADGTDLAASVTIAIGTFQNLISKAADQ